MIFSTQLHKTYQATEIDKDIRRIIYYNILAFPMGTNEVLLNEYFKTNYHKTLKQVCKQLLAHCLVTIGANNTLLVIINEPKENCLANFITFGDMNLQGSNILRKSFGGILERR